MKINNHDHGKFTAPGEIRFQRMLPGPIERVWAYLTDPEKRGCWLASGILEQKPGGKVQFNFRHSEITPHVEEIPDKYKELCAEGSDACNFTGLVLRCDPPHQLSYTWPESDGRESEVTFELTPQGERVLLVLTHRKLGDNRHQLLSVSAGWHAHVDILIAKLDGAPVPPFWSAHTRLEAEYEKLLPAAPRHRS